MAVDTAVNSSRVIETSDGAVCPVVHVVVRPPFGSGGVPVSVEEVDSIPNNATTGNGTGWFAQGGLSSPSTNYYANYDPVRDVLYVTGSINYRGRSLIQYFEDSYVYKKYLFFRERPTSVVNAEILRLTLTQKIVAWLTFCFSIGLTVWLLWECYKTLDRLLWLAHRGYTQRRISSYIDRVARENGGDPLGEGSKSTWERDFGDEPLPKPPGY